MGIKHFFFWFRNKFANNIREMYKNDKVPENIDVFLIDMNGLFHNATQKVYKYGAFAPPKDLFNIVQKPKQVITLKQQLDVFKEVCASLDELVATVKPKKRLVLCVDGPAPIAKQCQQRKRRFMSALSNSDCAFDGNSITPGTRFMDHLTKYIDWHIRKKITERTALYNLEVIFSNEKVVGEGEHKCFAYLRKYGDNALKYCLHGMDADLIMLSLAAEVQNFYILRENPNSYTVNFYFIDIGNFKKELTKLMQWEANGAYKKGFNSKTAIHDFIFMCFMVGNDFLPHIPAIEIITGGIDYMLDIYKTVGKDHGHLTKRCTLRKKALIPFFTAIGKNEKAAFLSKVTSVREFIPDELMNSCIDNADKNAPKFKILEYRKKYYEKKFPKAMGPTDSDESFQEDIVKICHEYLQGMQWVLSYYINGVSDWQWQYPYHYAPFANTIAKCIESFSPERTLGPQGFESRETKESTPSLPFIQLLSVLPPKSAGLLPEPLSSLLIDEKSSLKEFCPKEFEIDAGGCRAEWEATVILPFVNLEKVNSAYAEKVKLVNPKELDRNKHGRTFIYRRVEGNRLFRSFYGDFVSNTVSEPFEL